MLGGRSLQTEHVIGIIATAHSSHPGLQEAQKAEQVNMKTRNCNNNVSLNLQTSAAAVNKEISHSLLSNGELVSPVSQNKPFLL